MSTPADSKVKVIGSFGVGSAVGEMNAIVGMTTDQGTIVSVANLPIIEVSGTSVAMNTPVYAGEVYITAAVASGTYSYPSGDGALVYGHSSLWMSGVPQDTNPSQGCFMTATKSVYTFDR
jgi:hypothetical protein